ncbi:hypothetical protein [Ancylobacter terrae]|uniref:hypothetical protein n=1 Tax=Ancylobacter sp. sgz301288 TaxID=3342077 RepID=UPI0038584E0A
MSSSLPSEQDTLVGYFCRHLVALCIAFRAQDGGTPKRKFAVYPGLIIEIGGKVLFLTAGHSLEQIRNGIEGEILSEYNAVLADTFGDSAS